jgi:hypothetical protein
MFQRRDFLLAFFPEAFLPFLEAAFLVDFATAVLDDFLADFFADFALLFFAAFLGARFAFLAVAFLAGATGLDLRPARLDATVSMAALVSTAAVPTARSVTTSPMVLLVLSAFGCSPLFVSLAMIAPC